MSEMITSKHMGPLAFFDFARHYGGSFQGTVMLARELGRLTDVMVIDAYGVCEKYVSDLKKLGIDPVVLFPGWGRTTIGGRNSIQRLARMAFSIPHMIKVASRLYRVLRETRPRAIWVNSEKALFAAWLAVPRHMPMVMMVRTEMWKTRPYCAFAWRRADAAIGVSENCLHYLRSTGYAHGNLYVIYDGIDVDRTLERSKLEPGHLPCSNPSALRLAFPASLGGPAKGHESGIRAIARFVKSGGQANLWICGDVPSRVSPEFYNRMRRLTSELNVQERVHFLGYRDDIESVIAKSDIVFLPSHTEGLPRSLLEAMALAKPVISTRVGGIPELVRDRIDGILVNPGDVEALVNALQVLSDPNTREKMGHSGQRRVRESFSLSGEAEQFLRFMDSLVERRRSS